jgi:hypothetical protein
MASLARYPLPLASILLALDVEGTIGSIGQAHID